MGLLDPDGCICEEAVICCYHQELQDDKVAYEAESSDIGLLHIEDKHFREMIKACYEIYNRKGHDYTIGNADKDRLYNFKATAERVGITPMQVWAVHFDKQILAVAAYVKTGKVESEGISSRFHDIVNYAVLGKLLAEEDKDE